MLIKLNIANTKAIEELKAHFECTTASKAAAEAVLSFLATLDELEEKTRRVGELEAQAAKIKEMIRSRAALDAELVFYSNQRGLKWESK